MQGGFSFCGTDIADLGLEYVPETANTYVYAGADYKIHEQMFDGHDGGYFYGSTVTPKVFTQRCIFQETHINDGVLTKVERFFRRGRSGRLIFKKRPWVYYVATVTDINMTTITNYMNGIITIQMKAYYPYGRHDELFYSEGHEYNQNMIANSAMLPKSMAVATSAVADGEELTAYKEIYLYNGGTENAAVAIEIAGDVGDGVTIANTDADKKCSFVALSKEVTTDQDRYLISDAINGRTVLVDESTNNAVDASLYHDYGFIYVQPSEIIMRNKTYDVAEDGTIDAPDGEEWNLNAGFNNIFAQNGWHEIIGTKLQDRKSLVVSPPLSGSTTVSPIFVKMDKIIIHPTSTMAQTKLNFVYKPTFA